MRKLSVSLFTLLCAVSSMAQSTFNAVYHCTNFVSQPVQVTRAILTPDTQFIDYTNAILADTPIYGVTDTNGVVTFTNVQSGYSYIFELDTVYKKVLRTNGFPAGLTGTVNAEPYIGVWLPGKRIFAYTSTNTIQVVVTNTLSTDTTQIQTNNGALGIKSGAVTTNTQIFNLHASGSTSLTVDSVMTVGGPLTVNNGAPITGNGVGLTNLQASSVSDATSALNLGNAANVFTGTRMTVTTVNATNVYAATVNATNFSGGSFSGNGTNVFTGLTVYSNGTLYVIMSLPQGTPSTAQMQFNYTGPTNNIGSYVLVEGNPGGKGDVWLYCNPIHSVTGEGGLGALQRIAIVWGLDLAGASALQFGPANIPGAGPVYINTDGTATSGVPMRWSLPFALHGTYWSNNAAQVFYADQRAEAVDTNGNFRVVWYNVPSASATAENNTLPGATFGTLAAFETWTGRNIAHGGYSQDIVQSAPSGTNVTFNFDSANQHYDITTNVNLILANTYGRTNLLDRPRVKFFPGLGSYSLKISAPNTNVWWATNLLNGALSLTTIPASTIVTLEIEQEVQNGLTNYLISPHLFPYVPTIDTDAQAFFTAVGGGLSASASNGVNNLVLSAKSHGYWSNLKLLYPFVGGTSNSCSWNLASPLQATRIKWVNSTGTNFIAAGVYGKSSATFYGDTGFALTSLSSINSTCMGFWGETATFGDSYIMGCQDTPTTALNKNGNFLDTGGFNYSSGAINSSFIGTSPSATFTGFLAFNRTGASAQQGYNQAGAAGGTTIGTATAFPANNLFLFTLNSGGSPFSNTDAGIGVFFVGQNMTTQNMTDFASDLATFAATVGK